jgi:hypothetical protein
MGVNGSSVNYEDVLRDLESKRMQLESAISTIRTLAGREDANPFKAPTNGSTQPKPTNGVVTMGFGRNADVPITDLSMPDLEYYKSWHEMEKTKHPGKSPRITQRDADRLLAINNEIARRR